MLFRPRTIRHKSFQLLELVHTINNFEDKKFQGLQNLQIFYTFLAIYLFYQELIIELTLDSTIRMIKKLKI